MPGPAQDRVPALDEVIALAPADCVSRLPLPPYDLQPLTCFETYNQVSVVVDKQMLQKLIPQQRTNYVIA